MIEIAIGVCFGILGGMGLGGGMVLIPALVFFLNASQHTAQGVNLIAFLPAAIAASIAHIKNKQIEWHAVLQMGGFGLIGAVLGAFIAVNIEDFYMRKAFGVFLIAFAIYTFVTNEGLLKNKHNC